MRKGTNKKSSGKNKVLKVLSVMIFICGVGLILYGVINYRLENKTSAEALENFDSLKKQANEGTALSEDLYCKLSFVELNTSKVIFKGADAKTLKKGSGWRDDSHELGEKGFIVIMGHRDTSMNFIQDIQIGEFIKAETLTEEFTYKVSKIDIFKPKDVLNGEDLDKSQLRLITCYPFSFFGAAPDRFVVTADLVE